MNFPLNELAGEKPVPGPTYAADAAGLRDAIDSVLAEPTYRQTAGRLTAEIASTETLEETLSQYLAEASS